MKRTRPIDLTRHVDETKADEEIGDDASCWLACAVLIFFLEFDDWGGSRLDQFKPDPTQEPNSSQPAAS
jgi:hypothetical protein